ncbi:hypothetical protein [Halosimplex pelagicum]|uniref:Uncharacterized protein n=1 Tax=Halosimplex pelagicum TaxID=869886 RepID=A0A7D5PFW2_9EURY|nr:hypothetical protein [Halosimplex pelagicum]QLH83800.1 hypothetical protein HZS54_20155 [Halosimplex pelagicum]
MAGSLEHVAFDIETTGLAASDAVTVVGFELGLGCRVFYRGGNGTAAECEAAVSDRSGEHVRLTRCESEAELLEAMAEFVVSRLRANDVLLVAYNGETWRGGFDLPFLRTRFAAHDVQWPFHDLPYADVFPVVRDLFNTRVNGDAASDLETAYDVLCGGAHDEFDPFDDSSEAVAAFEDGRAVELVLHNVSDVLRTGALSALAQRYCSKSDFNVKSLTPTVEEYGDRP